jgi:SSS family solute:Na+ symporter
MVLPLIFPQSTLFGIERNMVLFFFILLTGAITSIAVSLLTKPEDEEVLKKFYRQVRPWGFWGPICDMVCREDPGFKPNTNFKRDMLNSAVGIVWQTMFVLIPIYLVIKDFRKMWISIAVLVVTSIFLKFNWINKMEDN